jgi:hypothetical protein
MTHDDRSNEATRTNLDVLPAAQAAVVRRVLDEEGAAREHLVVLLSGAHAYGFASPDSDFDLKAVHVTNTAQLVGLEPVPPPRDRMEVIEGVEIDYTSNEIGPVLAGIIGGNGNYLERILGAPALVETSELDALRPLARAALSRRVFRHYAGFANSQRKATEDEAGTTAKRVLYVLRTALTGTHLLRTRELVTDVTALLDDYGFGAAHELVAIKRAGERTKLAPADVARFRADIERAMAGLEEARERSVLPESPPAAAIADLSRWLIALRRARF